MSVFCEKKSHKLRVYGADVPEGKKLLINCWDGNYSSHQMNGRRRWREKRSGKVK